MKKILVIASLFISSSIFAQQKIAYYNSGQLYTSIPEVKKIDSVIKAEKKSIDDEINSQIQEHNLEVQKYIQDSSKLQPNIKKIKEDAFVQNANSLSKLRDSLYKNLQIEQDTLIKKYQLHLLSVISKIAVEQKIDFIIDVANSNSFFAFNKKDDITDLIIKKY